MVITLTPQLESALAAQARRRGVAPEALDALGRQFRPPVPPESYAPRWRRWLTRVGLLAALLGGVGFCRQASLPRNGILVDRLEADLRDAVPPGSSRAKAEEWFKAHGLRYAMITEVSTNRPVGYSSRVDNDSWMENAEIRIEVHFDDNWRVTKVTIYRYVPSF